MPDKVNVFGSNHNVLGSSTADLLLKTAGKVRILWGNRYIDLLKGGKINVDSDFIFETDSIGEKDGIYVIGDKIYLKAGGKEILLSSEGNTYLSLLEEQKTTSEEKYQGLVNIGFLYPTLDKLKDANSLKNGLVYVEATSKLYLLKDGNVSEFLVNISGKFNEPIIITKSGESKGAIVINGEGINNSLAFNSLWIYSDGEEARLDCKNAFTINIDSKNVISFLKEEIQINVPVTFKSGVNGRVGLDLDEDDNSKAIAYTSWVNNRIYIPNLVITIYSNIPENHKETITDDEGKQLTVTVFPPIPNGFVFCDGLNGTPKINPKRANDDTYTLWYIIKSDNIYPENNDDEESIEGDPPENTEGGTEEEGTSENTSEEIE